VLRGRTIGLAKKEDGKMLGFVIGAVCAVALFRGLHRARRFHGRYGCGGYGHYGYGPTRFSGRRWFMRSLFERLETTPGQEKAVVDALDELTENRKVVRDEWGQARADLARALRGGIIDDSTLDDTFARHDRLVAQLRVSFVEALKKVTEVLDERQRRLLADRLEGGGRWSVWA
jgi:hypothetical protein